MEWRAEQESPVRQEGKDFKAVDVVLAKAARAVSQPRHWSLFVSPSVLTCPVAAPKLVSSLVTEFSCQQDGCLLEGVERPDFAARHHQEPTACDWWPPASLPHLGPAAVGAGGRPDVAAGGPGHAADERVHFGGAVHPAGWDGQQQLPRQVVRHERSQVQHSHRGLARRSHHQGRLKGM